MFSTHKVFDVHVSSTIMMRGKIRVLAVAKRNHPFRVAQDWRRILDFRRPIIALWVIDVVIRPFDVYFCTSPFVPLVRDQSDPLLYW